jgi:hypothetical protein
MGRYVSEEEKQQQQQSLFIVQKRFIMWTPYHRNELTMFFDQSSGQKTTRST